VVYSPATRDNHADSESRLPRNLLIVVALLGFATYCISFGSVGDVEVLGWYARFAALAGLLAAFGVTTKGKPHPTATAMLAAMGFLDALSSAVASTDRGWALTAIAVLNALQAVAALAALLVGPKAISDSTSTGYAAYVDYYNQAVRNYYQQAQSSPPEQSQRSGYGQAYADAQVAPHVQRAQRASQYADYSELDHTGARGSSAQDRDSGSSGAGRPAGLPTYGQAPTAADQAGPNTGESAPPPSPT
jgi:hypothetical protein